MGRKTLAGHSALLGAPVLSAQGLTRSYGSIQAVIDVSIDAQAGRVRGLIGRNGAGKTTTLEMLAAIDKPASGTVHIGGIDAVAHPRIAQSHIGYSPQEISIALLLTVTENIEFCARLHLPPREAVRAARETLGNFDLAELGNRLGSELSSGQKRLTQLAMALVHKPALVILDEPTAGVDIVARSLVQEQIKELSSRGCAVIYSTHYLEEAEALCDDVSIIADGTIRVQGTVVELVRKHALGVVVVHLERNTDAGLLAHLSSLNDVDAVIPEGDEVRLLCHDPQQTVEQALAALSQVGEPIRTIDIKPSNLEAAFSAIVDDGPNETETW